MATKAPRIAITEIHTRLMPKVSARLPGETVSLKEGSLWINDHKVNLHLYERRSHISSFRSVGSGVYDLYVGSRTVRFQPAARHGVDVYDLDGAADAVVAVYRHDVEFKAEMRQREKNREEFDAIWGGEFVDAMKRAGLTLSSTRTATPIELKFVHADSSAGMLKLLRLLHEHGYIRSPVQEDGSHTGDAELIMRCLEAATPDRYEV